MGQICLFKEKEFQTGLQKKTQFCVLSRGTHMSFMKKAVTPKAVVEVLDLIIKSLLT